MSRVKIVTDSTAYLPPQLCEQYGIEVIPLYVLFGQQTYRDNVDIQPAEFYQRLQTFKNGLPTTSQPSAGDFQKLYRRLAGECDAIVSVHISSVLSGTLASAEQARALVPDVPIHLIDSRSTSAGLGYVVLAAARAAAAGASAEEAAKAALALVPKVRVYFALETLHYLHMGGRIGGGAALLGAALGIKPILEIRDGRIEAAGKVRSKRKALEFLVERLVADFGEGATVRAATLSAMEPEEAKLVADMLAKRLNVVESYTVELSPVLGVHVGPGTVGAVACPA